MSENPPFQHSRPFEPTAACGDCQAMAVRIDSLLEWRREVTRKLDGLAADNSRVRLLEHQMLQLNVTLERLTEGIERLETRLLMLEKAEPGNERVQKLLDKGIWAALGVLAVYVLKKVGLLS